MLQLIAMKRIFSWVILLGLLQQGGAQTLTILTKENNVPLEDVLLIGDHPKTQSQTNHLGQVDLKPFIHCGQIDIRSIGFVPRSASYADLASMGVIYLEPAVFTLDELVVSASRWRESGKGLPMKIRTISPQEMRFQQPQTAADLLGISGEVAIQKSQQGGGSPMIRGFATNRLLYAIDGVRMNTAIFRAGNLQNVISLDPFTLQSAEIIFGPGSVVYGSDAIGGVMAFQTWQPQFSALKKLVIRPRFSLRHTTANGEKTGHAALEMGTKKLAILTSFSRHDFGDLRMGQYGPASYLRPFFVVQQDGKDLTLPNPDPRVQTPSGYHQTNLMHKVRYKPSEDWEFTYSWHNSATSSYPRYDRLSETSASGAPVWAEWRYGPQIWRMHLLSATHRPQKGIYDEVTLRLARQFFEESRIDRSFAGSNRYRLRTQVEQVVALSANADFKKVFPKGVLYYGLESVGNRVLSFASARHTQTGAAISVADRYPQANWKSHALFGNYQHALRKLWTVQAGIRYNLFQLDADFTRNLPFFPFDFKTTNLDKGALTANAGVVYSPSIRTRISLHGATGFRAPNVDDMGKLFDFLTGDVVVPNPGLREELAYNGEIHASHLAGNALRLDGTVYYTWLQHAMVRRPFLVAGKDSILYNGKLSRIFAIQNAAYVSIFGFHAGFEYRLSKGWYFSGRYNYQRGREEMNSGNRSSARQAAPPFGTGAIGVQTNRFHLQASVFFNAEVSWENLNEEERLKTAIYAQDESGRPYCPSWYTLNLKGSLNLLRGFTLSLGLENLTNRRYRTYSSGIASPGLNGIISLQAGW